MKKNLITAMIFSVFLTAAMAVHLWVGPDSTWAQTEAAQDISTGSTDTSTSENSESDTGTGADPIDATGTDTDPTDADTPSVDDTADASDNTETGSNTDQDQGTETTLYRLKEIDSRYIAQEDFFLTLSSHRVTLTVLRLD